MQDLNEVRITGTIFNEPKYVKTQTNGLLSRFTVAVHRKDPSKSVDFLSVIAWDDMLNLSRSILRIKVVFLLWELFSIRSTKQQMEQIREFIVSLHRM